MPPELQALGDHRVHLRSLPGQNQELLGIPFQRLIKLPFNLLRRVDMRLVRGEGAVLAVALARA